MTSKSHKAMGDDEWMSRLKRFAASGIWPSDAGNRPAPRQKKWYDLYQKIEKCPLQSRGQTTLFRGYRSCNCGFHIIRAPSHPVTSVTTTASPSSPVQSPRQPALTLSMFDRQRFGGTHSAVAKPNLVSRKPCQPLPCPAVTSSSASTGSTSIYTVIPSSPDETYTITPGTPRTPSPGEVSVRTTTSGSPSPSEAALRTTTAGCISPAQTPTTMSTVVASSVGEDLAGPASASFWLPVEMKNSIPVQDQRWIASALYHAWKAAPQLKAVAPTPDRFFTHRLMVWMPYHQWKVRVFCPTCGKQLTGYGVHKRVRKVLDIDTFYLLVTEILRCTVCRLTFLSTSQTVRDQLDLPHQKMFRLILTQKYACDIRVIRLLWDRTLGNSPTRLVKQLKENHGEEWLNRLAHYLEECASFVNRPSLFPVACQEPPEPIDVPTSRWLLSVYGRDIISRMDHIKATITSTFGSILKMDSTKKITKKLAGIGRGTAFWLTSVGNEIGQILISVLTAEEGAGLNLMTSDLMKRYSQAGVAPPKVLYVDSHCCVEEGLSKLQQRFAQWPNLQIRLDIWHFMRRMSEGCTTDAHALYPTFMAGLSSCIFEWDPEDVALLRRAVREQLRQEGVSFISDALVDKRITKNDLAFHCRRRTRGEQTTIQLIDRLLHELLGDKGRDLMGIPLLDKVRMEYIWRVQKRHIRCIQDVPGIPLYTETGTTTKGGIVLTRYRCARGSISLESFHCHLQRFIPGTTANSLNFQLYLLEGLSRWNQDRAAASVASQPASLMTYAGDVLHCVNTNSLKVFGRKYVSSFQPPAKYTGELIGVDYLLRQTGLPLQDVNLDSEETEGLLEDLAEEDEQEDEGFEEDHSLDLTFPTCTIALCPACTAALCPAWIAPCPACTIALCPACTAAPAQPGLPPVQPAPSPCVQPALLPSAQPGMPSVQPEATITLPVSVSGDPQQVPEEHLPALLPSVQPALLPSVQSALLPSVQPALLPSAQPGLPPVQPAPSPCVQPALLPSAQPGMPSVQPEATITLPVSVSGDPQQVPEEHLAVDEHGMPGMDRVDSLAEYLVELRTQTSLTLSRQQASTIVALWQNMLDYDKQRVVFAARHQDKLTTGRFRSPKKRAEFTPGMDSLKRSALTTTAPLAQWPDCCRLVEAIFVRLCGLHKSPKKQGRTTLTRWSLILQDYRKIRQLILGNGTIMQETSIQLVEVNQTTLNQWHNRRVKKQDNALVLQGIDLPSRVPVAAETLLAANVRPAVTPQVPGEPHTYHLPDNTTGQAVTKRMATDAVAAAPAAVRPKVASKRQLFPKPPTPGPPQFLPSSSMPPVLFGTPQTHVITFIPLPSQQYPLTQASVSKALPATTSTTSARRKPYQKKVLTNTCRKCGQYRTAGTGHSQYKGTIYCPSTEALSKEEWLEQMRRK
ncbi:uncharacterized protein LOC118803096 [Colossoma macropomum]|uniref:uncharacterized protein LOC118803096 n=1 Tax=Colossoma macropomum TaxID=42526 RepID=UPI001863AA77|nr:uncharacterized protein LOC118803096 [Colossoma macropomum]